MKSRAEHITENLERIHRNHTKKTPHIRLLNILLKNTKKMIKSRDEAERKGMLDEHNQLTLEWQSDYMYWVTENAANPNGKRS